VFDICKNNSHVTQLRLHKDKYRIGDVVTGTLDFSKSTLPCFQVSVYLEHIETVIAPFGARGPRTIRKVCGEWHDMVLGIKRFTFHLAIPPSANTEFASTAGKCDSCNAYLCWMRFERGVCIF
jgi:hypothetical protein